MRLSCDIESYSECDLKASGARRYAEHPSTEILCIAYAVDDEAPLLWTPGQPWPEVFEHADEIWAWNSFFESSLFECVLKLSIPRAKWRCSMSLALSAGFPGSLDMASSALGIGRKDIVGQQAMRRLCKPRKPTLKDESVRFTPELHPELFIALYRYCMHDVDLERDVWRKLPAHKFSDVEQAIFLVDMEANARGIHVDVPTARAIRDHAFAYGTRLAAEARDLTGGIGVKQTAALSAWLELPNVQSSTIDAALKAETAGTDRHRVLQIRSILSRSSVAKYDSMLASVCPSDSRCKGLIQFQGAGRTGRWAGRLLQVQNLPRGILGKRAPGLLEDCQPASIDPDVLELVYGDPFEVYASYIRSCLTATPGKVLYAGDYSQVEARIALWFGGDTDSLAAFADDSRDAYCEQAADIRGEPVTKADEFWRFLGKSVVLGCGFQMGAERFKGSCEEKGVKIDLELAQRAVDSFRARNPGLVRCWYALDRAARKAIASRGMVVACGRLAFKCGTNFLQMKLPSGRLLSYYQPRIDGENNIRYKGVNQRTRDWGEQKSYGGKFLENAVQATARDLMRDAILRLVEDGRWTYLVSIHDEVIAEAEPGLPLEEFLATLTVLPDWAAGIPLKAEGWSGKRYRKG